MLYHSIKSCWDEQMNHRFKAAWHDLGLACHNPPGRGHGGTCDFCFSSWHAASPSILPKLILSCIRETDAGPGGGHIVGREDLFGREINSSHRVKGCFCLGRDFGSWAEPGTILGWILTQPGKLNREALPIYLGGGRSSGSETPHRSGGLLLILVLLIKDSLV